MKTIKFRWECDAVGTYFGYANDKLFAFVFRRQGGQGYSANVMGYGFEQASGDLQMMRTKAEQRYCWINANAA